MPTIATIPLQGPLLRGSRRPRVALVGRRRTGKSSIFQAASSPAVHHERLAGVGGAYQECLVDVGLDQISLVDLPDIETLHHLREHDRVVLMYLLWGDRWPAIARHESEQPSAAFPAPAPAAAVAAAANAQVFGPDEPTDEGPIALLAQADAVRAELRAGVSRWRRFRSDVSLRPFFDRRTPWSWPRLPKPTLTRPKKAVTAS